MPTRPPLLIACLFGLWSTVGAQVEVPESAEPNASAATATPLACGGQAVGSLDAGGGDRDWWAVTLLQTSDLVAFATSRGTQLGFGGTSADDTVLSLYDTDGITVLASNDNNHERPFAQRGFFSTLRAASLPVGTYYLEVGGWSALGEGDYALDVACAAPPLAFCGGLAAGAGETEPNDAPLDLGVASALPCAFVTGGIDVSNDEDWWSLSVASTSRIVVDARQDTLSATPIFDSQLWLFDSSGTTQLAFDDDGGFQNLARITIDVEPGDYLIRVRSFSSWTGDYELAIDAAPLAGGIPVLADVWVDTSSDGCPGSGGVPLMLVPRQNEWPRIGSWFSFDIAGAVNPPVVLFGNIPQAPVDLGLIGAPGCLLAVQPLGSLPATPTVPGEFEFGLPIGSDPGQIGVTFYCQAAAIDLGSNALGVTLSDRLVMWVGADG